MHAFRFARPFYHLYSNIRTVHEKKSEGDYSKLFFQQPISDFSFQTHMLHTFCGRSRERIYSSFIVDHSSIVHVSVGLYCTCGHSDERIQITPQLTKICHRKTSETLMHPLASPKGQMISGSDCRLECTASPGQYNLWWCYNHSLRSHKSSDTAINPIEGTSCAALGLDVVDAEAIICIFNCQIIMP